MEWAEFQADEKTRSATIRAVEIIGEAACHMPADFRECCPENPGQRIVGMRNVLAHAYIGANPRVIFDTAAVFIPDLIAKPPAIVARAATL